MNVNIYALILLAGTGSRLRPITKSTHKALIKIGRYPLLWYSISNLLNIGVKNIYLVTGYKSNQIKNFVKEFFPNEQIIFIHNKKYMKTNSIYSYYLARNYIRGKSFLRLEGDIYYSRDILRRIINTKFNIVSAVEKKIKKSQEEYSVSTTKGYKIMRYGKNIPINESYGEAKGIEFISSKGSYLIYKSLVDIIKKNGSNEYAEFCYQNLINQKNDIYYLRLRKNDYWFELDTQDDLKTIRLFANKYE